MNKKGFTLIELLIVIAIIGIVAAIAIPNLLTALQKGKQKSTMGDMHSIGTAIESYITDNSMAPVANSTIANSLDHKWFHPFYIKTLPTTDAWGTDFQYASQGTELDDYSVISWGRNKASGGKVTVAAGTFYDVTSLADFNNDIVYSNGQFTFGPKTKK